MDLAFPVRIEGFGLQHQTRSSEVKPPQRLSDAELLRLSATGKQQAFEELMQRHFVPVHRIAWRLLNGAPESEDVVQEAFLRLWRNPAQIKDANALRSWLARVASNLALDRLRAGKTVLAELDENIAADGLSSEAALVRSNATSMVDEALARLPERQRLALTLVHFEEMSQIEAATVMETSVDALESLVARGRRNLKAMLAPERDFLLATLASGRT